MSGSLLHRLPLLVVLIGASGCSVETGGLGPAEDAGPVDAGGLDAPDIDAPMLDATTMRDGYVPPRDAGQDATTVRCEPGASRCSADGTYAIVCDESGTREVDLGCRAGCAPDTRTCRIVRSCSLTVERDLAPDDELSFSLCGGGGELYARTTPACTSTDWGEDRMFRFVLDRPRRVWVDLKDVDGTVPVDTVLYIRTDCADADSQIACHDDLDCSEVDPEFACGSGNERRQSRIEMDLDPGAYWVVADSLDWNERSTQYRCGEVLLRYRWIE